MKAVALVLLLLAQEPKDPPWVVAPKAPIQHLAHKTFKSAAMGVEVGYHLYLPPGYDEEKERRYPVIYWHHGMNCHESNDQFPAAIVDKAIRDKVIPPLIVVYPNGGGRSFYADSADGTIRSETMITTELIPHIDATCRTIAGREGRALQGMSMGGFGVLKLAFKHPELYSSVVAFAGGFLNAAELDARRPGTVARLFKTPADFDAQTPMALAKPISMPVKLFVGTKDFLLEANRRMRDVLVERKIPHEYEEIPDIAHDLGGLSRYQGTKTLEFAVKAFGAK